MIEIRNAVVIKSGNKLFDNFSWTINDGEHWVVTGPNGAGKTTLLELISGAVHLPHGELIFSFINGDTWDERYIERKRKIHYIPANAIHTLLSETHGLYYQQRYYGIGDERVPLVSDILGKALEKINGLPIPESFSINHLINLELTRLSNGQLKKVLLLKALLTEIPKVLLLDYPFEGLDFDSREDLCDFIDFLASTYGVQIILVDHHHHLPKVINRRLKLKSFAIEGKESVGQGSTPSFPLQSVEDKSKGARLGIPVVEIRDLKIQYQDHIVLQNFNWTVHQGDRWALIGRNGSGKTTLFSMIFADHPMAYSQQVFLFGRRRGSGESIWDIKKRIAYLGPELVSYLTPRSIGLSARDYIRSVNKKLNEDSLNALIAHFAAETFIDRPVRVLSSGELQLMAIMNCFLTDKELLLLDEPFQFLDTTQRVNLSRFLQDHLHPDTTLILITHYANDLTEWTNRTKAISNQQ
jgi:molybdate transport system ATP-binding protein